jgi:hypothetical protein
MGSWPTSRLVAAGIVDAAASSCTQRIVLFTALELSTENVDDFALQANHSLP